MRGSREMRVEGRGVALSWSCLRLPGIYSRGLNCKVLTFKGLALPVCEKEHLSVRPPACLARLWRWNNKALYTEVKDRAVRTLLFWHCYQGRVSWALCKPFFKKKKRKKNTFFLSFIANCSVK